MISFSINVCVQCQTYTYQTQLENAVSVYVIYAMNCSADSVMQWSFKLVFRYGVSVLMDIFAHVLLNKHRDNVKVLQFFEFSNI